VIYITFPLDTYHPLTQHPDGTLTQQKITTDTSHFTLKTIRAMKVIFFLIILSLIFAVGFLIAFLWATRAGQFDDEYTPSVRILFDDEIKSET
jgi:cbb3-type cytochrome oxidase maturation protein